MEEVKAYSCDHCSKVLKTKGSMRNHEKSCWKNEENRHKCFDSCKNLIKENVATEYGNHTEYYCKAIIGARMYSYKAQYNSRIDKTGLTRMPLECNKFKFNEQIPF